MLLPAEVEQALSGRASWDRLGEEGKLYRLMGDAGNGMRGFYAKLWYSLREIPKGGVGRWGFIGMPRDSGCSIVSPYFHKRVFYEYRVIRSLFPENTLKVVLAYDQRIKPGLHGDTVFTIKGYPVTVSCEVEADCEGMSKRDEIVLPVYEKIHAARDKVHAGDPTANADAGLYTTVAGVDTQMAGVFGEQLKFLGAANPNYSPAEVISKLRQESPDSPVLEFMENGIMPIHPAFNYIPRPADQETGKAAGTFIELMIYDGVAVRRGLQTRFGTRADVFKLFSRFEFYSMLEKLFDAALRHEPISRVIIQNAPLQATLFQYMEQVRKSFNRTPGKLAEQIGGITVGLIDVMTRQCASAQQSAKKL